MSIINNGRKPTAPEKTPTSLATSRLDLIDDWENLAQAAQFVVSRLAALCKVSERQLRRYFQQRFHVRPSQWLEELRLNEAIKRLAHDEPMKAITENLGFGHVSHFCRVFKRRYHMTPMHYVFSQRQRLVMSEGVRGVR